MKNMDFEVLILGTDPNAYYMARCCYEAYQKKPYVIGKNPLPFTTYSSILNVSYCEEMWEEEAFLRLLDNFAKNHKDTKILLISTNETYTEFISKNKDQLNKNYIYNFPSVKIIKSLTNKETFYQTYASSALTFPKTLYFNPMQDKIPKDLTYPVILKPANVVSYNHISFAGKKKIFKLENVEELKTTIKQIKKSKYDDKLILQEFIPGEDDALFDAVIYCNTKGKAQFLSFAQIGLQERTSNMVGNAAVLINGFNTTQGDINNQAQIIKEFMESIHYQGYAEVDMKYDYRDNTFKVLEINARQGRCSYYLAGLGKNLVQVLIDDCLNHQESAFELLDKEVMLSFVPKGIIKKYITNEAFKKEALKLWKNVLKPMDAPADKNIKRYFMLKKRGLSYYKEYKNSYWRY